MLKTIVDRSRVDEVRKTQLMNVPQPLKRSAIQDFPFI
jgi:hypothetical protein